MQQTVTKKLMPQCPSFAPWTAHRRLRGPSRLITPFVTLAPRVTATTHPRRHTSRASPTPSASSCSGHNSWQTAAMSAWLALSKSSSAFGFQAPVRLPQPPPPTPPCPSGSVSSAFLASLGLFALLAFSTPFVERGKEACSEARGREGSRGDAPDKHTLRHTNGLAHAFHVALQITRDGDKISRLPETHGAVLVLALRAFHACLAAHQRLGRDPRPVLAVWDTVFAPHELDHASDIWFQFEICSDMLSSVCESLTTSALPLFVDIWHRVVPYVSTSFYNSGREWALEAYQATSRKTSLHAALRDEIHHLVNAIRQAAGLAPVDPTGMMSVTANSENGTDDTADSQELDGEEDEDEDGSFVLVPHVHELTLD
eukprot:m.30146 g.30146  ORF g.30146 m.30146 type:complete len:371 (+) comp5178_c0_seq1:368-1480(+)